MIQILKYLLILTFVFYNIIILNNAYAQEKYRINNDSVYVIGLINYKKQDILSIMNILQKEYSLDEIQNLINVNTKLLYKSEFFEKIDFSFEKNFLVLKLHEYPILKNFEVLGDNLFLKQEITFFMSKYDIVLNRSINKNNILVFKKYLLEKYKILGFNSVSIDIEQVIDKNNYLNVKFIISSGEKLKINSLNIEGNHKYKKQGLVKNTIYKNINNNPLIYSNKNIQKIIDHINNYYLDRGYLNVKINYKEIFNKNNVCILIKIKEGNIYNVSDILINFSEFNDLDLKKNIEKKIMELNYKYFSNKKLKKIIKDIKLLMINNGYINCKIKTFNRTINDSNSIKLDFYIYPGSKFLLNKILIDKAAILKNHNLYQQYIREYQILKSYPYNLNAIKQIKNKISHLPFVKNINFNVEKDKNLDNNMNIFFNIEEKNFNSIMLNMGYSQLYKLILGFNLNSTNFFDTNYHVVMNSNFATSYKSIDFILKSNIFNTNYITQKFSGDFYKINNDYYNKTVFIQDNYNRYNFNLDYYYQISYLTSLSFGLGVNNNELFQDFVQQSKFLTWIVENNNNKYDYTDIIINYNVKYDSRDNGVFPNKGTHLDINFSSSIPKISSIEWYKINIYSNYFYSFFNNHIIFSIKNNIGYINNYYNNNNIPFYQNFFSGGWNSIRGFEQNSIGLCDTIKNNDKILKGRSIGGNFKINNSIDILCDVPYFNNKNLRLGMFLDFGNIYYTYNIPSYDYFSGKGIIWPKSKKEYFPKFKYSIGVEMQFLSPIGPLFISLSKPINANNLDNLQIFQFNIGQIF